MEDFTVDIQDFTWKEQFNTGIPTIDQEHQKLFRIIQRLFAFKEQEKDNEWICQEGIKFFKNHALQHFADEEKYMAESGYAGYDAHRRVHSTFREITLPALEKELIKTKFAPASVDHFLGVCGGWLVGHTLTEDLSIVGRHPRTWNDLLNGDETSAMKTALVQLMFDMFKLESHVISDAYNGERFGHGIYYRMVFGGDTEDDRHEVLMVFEESLILHTIGAVMGLQSNKLDARLVHAARYTSRQFIQRILESFPSMENYKLIEENLLSYDEFRNHVLNSNLQISMLLDTGAGYFAYCVIAPKMLTHGVGKAIEEKDALTDVENYLAQREQEVQEELLHPKPKVLVVDDSLTIREGMREMLKDDYDVTTVESGVAAIRAITLERPDLVLLDYEMPICDGCQTLQMLRSEPAFADLPVVFLTGRSDSKSVQNVMSLKAKGYLLKHLPPETLKQKITSFIGQ